MDTKAFPGLLRGRAARTFAQAAGKGYALSSVRCGRPSRIDMFSREVRDGFDQFGDETSRFTPSDEGAGRMIVAAQNAAPSPALRRPRPR